LRFFEEDTKGVKINPQIIIATGILLVALVLIARALIPIAP